LWQVELKLERGHPFHTTEWRHTRYGVADSWVIFPVEIDQTKTVGILKQVTKEQEPKLNNWTSSPLTLYKIDVNYTDDKSAAEKAQEIYGDLNKPGVFISVVFSYSFNHSHSTLARRKPI
jgi:hypothetical protein